MMKAAASKGLLGRILAMNFADDNASFDCFSKRESGICLWANLRSFGNVLLMLLCRSIIDRVYIVG